MRSKFYSPLKMTCFHRMIASLKHLFVVLSVVFCVHEVSFSQCTITNDPNTNAPSFRTCIVSNLGLDEDADGTLKNAIKQSNLPVHIPTYINFTGLSAGSTIPIDANWELRHSVYLNGTTATGYSATSKIQLQILDNETNTGLSITSSANNRIGQLTIDGFHFSAGPRPPNQLGKVSNIDYPNLISITNVENVTFTNNTVATCRDSPCELPYYYNTNVNLSNISNLAVSKCTFNKGSTNHAERSSVTITNCQNIQVVESNIHGGVHNYLPIKISNTVPPTTLILRKNTFTNNVRINCNQTISADNIYPCHPAFYTQYQAAIAPVFNDAAVKATGYLSGTCSANSIVDIYSGTKRLNPDTKGNEVSVGEWLGTATVSGTSWTFHPENNIKLDASLDVVYMATTTINNQTSEFSYLYELRCPGFETASVTGCVPATDFPLNALRKNHYLVGSIKVGNGIYMINENYFFNSTGANGFVPLVLNEDYLNFKGCEPVTGTINAFEEPKLDGVPAVICPNFTGNYELNVSPANGTLAINGVTSNSLTVPASKFKTGSNAVTYTAATACPKVTVETIVYEQPKFLDNVISSSVTTFSDNWPLDQAHAMTDIASSLPTYGLSHNLYSDGYKGIWRAEESYGYVTDRKQNVDSKQNVRVSSSPAFGKTGPVIINTSGTYDQMPMYDWSNGDIGACFPNWRRMNTITQYSPFSYQSEDKDVLKRYSAALYGYNGNLSTAQAANASLKEIAYEGFEEYSNGATINEPGKLRGGNLIFFTANPLKMPEVYREWLVPTAQGNRATIATHNDQKLLGKTVNLFGANLSNGTVPSFNEKNVFGKFKIESIGTDASNNQNSVLTLSSLESATFPIKGSWKGKISLSETIASGVFLSPSGKVSISKDKAHTGKLSLKLEDNVAWQQVYLQLTPNRSYVISAWVSSSLPASTYQSAANDPVKRGIQLEYVRSSFGNSTSLLFEPTGNVIEGWQKLEAEFEIPYNATDIILKIQVPAGQTDYYDDLRIYPANASMQSYVYNKQNLKVAAVLDDHNFATFYHYDQAGNLFLVKKETERGIMTIQESFAYQKKK